MPEQTVSVKVESSRSEYRIRIGAGVLGNCGTWARGCLGHDARRVVVISNSTVYGLYGERTVDGLGAAGFEKHVHLIGDGERYKSFRTLEHTLAFLSEKKL